MFDWCDDLSHHYFQISKLGFIIDFDFNHGGVFPVNFQELILQWSSVEEYLLAIFSRLSLNLTQKLLTKTTRPPSPKALSGRTAEEEDAMDTQAGRLFRPVVVSFGGVG